MVQIGARGGAREQSGAGLPERAGSAFLRKAAHSWRDLHAAARFAIEQRRLFLLYPVALIIGLIAYRILPFEPSAGAATGAAVLAAGLLLVFSRRPHLRPWLGLGAAICAGVMILPVHGALWGTPMLDSPRYGTFDFTIDEVIFDDGESQRWIISAIAPHEERADPGIRRARLAVNQPLEMVRGQEATARIRFYPVPPPVVPGGYDGQFVSYFAGIGAYGSLLGDVETTPVPATGAAAFVDQVRVHIGERVRAVLGERVGGIATALITGDQSRLSQDDRAMMASAGLAHVLAISGLHLTIVAGTIFLVARYGLVLLPGMADRFPVKRIAAGFGLLAAFAYLFVSGMGISAIRATIMLSLVFTAVMLARQALTMRNVAIAAVLIIVIDPVSVFRASFQLSFAAVIALIAAFELARDSRERKMVQANRFSRFMRDIAMTSLISGAATMLFTAYHFQQTAPFGLFGNLLAMPIVTMLLMPFGLMATLAIPFGIEAPFFVVMGWSIEAVLWCAQLVQTVSFGFDPAPILTPGALVIGLVALGWLAFFQNSVRLIGPLVAVPAIFLFTSEPAPDVMVADSTQAIAVRNGPDLALISGRTNTFATNVWSERYMQEIERGHEAMQCDGKGCVLQSENGFTIALVRDAAAFYEDCRLAEIVVARIAAPQFCAEGRATLIDARDLARTGAQMAYWNRTAGTFSLKPTIPDPLRPWRLTFAETLR